MGLFGDAKGTQTAASTQGTGTGAPQVVGQFGIFILK
jgi:hypothetical protein